jgi:hypothetical protein
MSVMGVSNALPDTIFDVLLGILGGAAGAWAADRYLDRIFGRSRTTPTGPASVKAFQHAPAFQASACQHTSGLKAGAR